jgi:hypothetical protein
MCSGVVLEFLAEFSPEKSGFVWIRSAGATLGWKSYSSV